MVADSNAGVFTSYHTPNVSTANKLPPLFLKQTLTEAYKARPDRTKESCIYQEKWTYVVYNIPPDHAPEDSPKR